MVGFCSLRDDDGLSPHYNPPDYGLEKTKVSNHIQSVTLPHAWWPKPDAENDVRTRA